MSGRADVCAPSLFDVEALFLAARNARDAAEVADARGLPAEAERARLRAAAGETERKLRKALARLPIPEGLSGEDEAALETMRNLVAAGLGMDDMGSAVPNEAAPLLEAIAALGSAYADAAESVTLDGVPISRVAVLNRLRREPDGARRRALFLALEPLWRALDGDGGDRSPYRAIMAAANATDETASMARSVAWAGVLALDVDLATLELWCVAILDAWRAATRARDRAPIEPWDWWWFAGEADRLVGPALAVDRLLEIDHAYHRALGADLRDLGVGFDVRPRPGRPPVTVAFTTFGARPHLRADGGWSPGQPWVLATYRDGGLAELNELVHETGHAIHAGGIRTRPAFATWPNSDVFTEALADLLALDITDPVWLGRWVDPALASIPEGLLRRSRYADVVLDAAWALFEIRAVADPGSRPNDIWTEITSDWLGITPHPEWSWWAIRGQLARSPGYMANYAAGAVVTADLRAFIREARGDWVMGDPDWYPWVRERLFRFGQSREAAGVIGDLLGRSPSPDALLGELQRLDSVGAASELT